MSTNKYSNPLDHILNCCEQGLIPKQFDILNAKDELQRLRKELQNLKDSFSYPTAWGKINDRGDIHDLRVMNNPYVDPKTVLPLYCNREEFEHLLSNLDKKEKK